MRYLGVDYGTRKTGLAFSDEGGTMGFPHAVVPTTELMATLGKLIPERDIGAAVIGESKDFAGADNPVAAGARRLGDELAERFGIPVYWEPETYTSAEARRQYEPQEKSRAPKERMDVDASAAALILTSYLSRHSHE